MTLIHAREREVMCRLLLDVLRNLHEAYAPANEPFGTRIETNFIGLCVAIGDLDGRPFNTTKIERTYQRNRRALAKAVQKLSDLDAAALDEHKCPVDQA